MGGQATLHDLGTATNPYPHPQPDWDRDQTRRPAADVLPPALTPRASAHSRREAGLSLTRSCPPPHHST